jgi:hypothetical protein
MLWVDGVDLAIEPASSPRYGVPLDSVQVDLAAPGGVSALTFDVEDPLKLLSFSDGQDVRLQRSTDAYPLFTGFVKHYRSRPAFGMQGRLWTITATGIEALLDWYTIPTDVTIFGTGSLLGVDLMTSIQKIVALSGIPVWAGASPPPASNVGTDATPIGNLPFGLFYDVALTAGTSVREAIEQIAIASYPPPHGGWSGVTIDVLGGIRAWTPATFGITTAPGPTITVGGATKGADLDVDVDTTSAVRGVIVKGTGITYTQMVPGIRQGPVRTIVDASLLTSTDVQVAAGQYIADHSATGRQRVRLDDTLVTGMLVIGVIDITDAATGLTGIFAIGGASITLLPTTMTTTITFGGLPATASGLVRSLTRDTSN